jgi:hypothetical protein
LTVNAPEINFNEYQNTQKKPGEIDNLWWSVVHRDSEALDDNVS